VGGISQNGGYFSHGIPVVWVVIGWLGFVVHWSAVFSANVSTYCAGSAGFWFCILSVVPFAVTMVDQSQASFQFDVLPPEVWFKYWSWLWEWLVRYSNCESMHQVCEVCM
jgi:hypothetical protein